MINNKKIQIVATKNVNFPDHIINVIKICESENLKF